MIRNTSKESRGEERAVSPVVGVALLIAITVVLAAVIGFVVLSSSNQTTDVPSARLDISQSGSTLTISHEGGDAIDTSNLEVVYGNTRLELTGSTLGATDTEISTGSEVSITDGWSSGDTVKVVWDDPDSDRKSRLASITVE